MKVSLQKLLLIHLAVIAVGAVLTGPTKLGEYFLVAGILCCIAVLVDFGIGLVLLIGGRRSQGLAFLACAGFMLLVGTSACMGGLTGGGLSI